LNEKMLNESIKKNAKQMLNVFHKVEKMFNLPNTPDKKLLKMFKEVKPKEIENLFDTPIKQSGKQSGGAIAEICENNRWENFSEEQQEQLIKAYNAGIWDPYNRGGGGQFSCTNNGFGDIEDEEDIECACKVDPISFGCLENDTMIESPGRGAEGATTCFNKENLALMYRRIPNMRGKNPLTNSAWNAVEIQWLIDEGVVPEDGDWLGERAKYDAYRALERRLTIVHGLFRKFMLTGFMCIGIILLVFGKINYDEWDRDYYVHDDIWPWQEDLMRGPDLELVARRLWWEQQHWAIIAQVWFGGAVALELVMLDIVRRSGIRRARIGHMADDRMRWDGLFGDEPHPANPLAILAPGFYNRAAGPWRAPRGVGRRNQPDHPQHGQLFYEAAGFPLRRRGDIHPADLAAAVPPAPDAIQQGNEQQDENGQQDGGRRRKTRRKKRRKRRRRRGGQPSRMTRGVQRQAKKIHKPQKPLQASAREFVPERDGNTGYDKEVSNADEWGRNIKPYPQSHMQSGHEEIARRTARLWARWAEAREAHEAAWPTPAENAASRAKPVGGRKRRRKSRRRKRTRRKKR
jgi:hypothetical protein